MEGPEMGVEEEEGMAEGREPVFLTVRFGPLSTNISWVPRITQRGR